jgi:hypothetical protein
VAYTHQGWFTEDQRYFIVGDEIDELNIGGNTRTIVFDLNDLDNPVFHFEHFGETAAIDHNGYVVGDKYYMANYRAGMRVLDISDIANQNISEIGYFDTYTASNSAAFDGAWNVYPFFASGNIVISDINRGFFLVKSNGLGITEAQQIQFSVYPNPSESDITITSANNPISTVEIYNVLGQLVLNLNFSDNFSENIDISSLRSGLYLIKINGSTTKKLIVK